MSFGNATLPRRVNTTGLAFFPRADHPYVCEHCGRAGLGRWNTRVHPGCRPAWLSARRREKAVRP